ncbi:MAG TPA: NAD+ synthase [Acidobacteriota bacterium]|nr:NAD+ synthase [Acidobacteriota bacterium]
MKINGAFVEKVLTRFIREELGRFGFSKGILGLSGGLDSATCAVLAARALGPENVLALVMPCGASFPADVTDATALARLLGIRSETVDIAPQIDAYFSRYPTENCILRGNKMARERMSILYDFSAREKALILGTSNKTELLVGYGTIHGDMACAINPMGDLYKTQVRELGAWLGVPKSILEKQPTAGLWPGQTDEGELGITYAELDAILYEMADRRKSVPEIVALGFKAEVVGRVADMVRRSEFKRKLPPIAKISSRTVGHDFLYPFAREK